MLAILRNGIQRWIHSLRSTDEGHFEVLRQREAAVAHRHNEIESLNLVGPLLQSDGLPVKDAYAVLHQKEGELAGVRREIEGLQIIAPLLSDEVPPMIRPNLRVHLKECRPWLDATGTDGPFSAMSAPRG